MTKQGFRTIEGVIWSEKGVGMREGDVELATLCLLTAPHRVPFPLRGGSKRKEGFERRSRSGAPLKNKYFLLRNPRPLVSNTTLGLVGGEKGIGHAMLADRVAPRALSLAGEAAKEKRDSNGAAEAELL